MTLSTDTKHDWFASGFTQVYGEDFLEVHSGPILSIDSLHTTINTARHLGFLIHQMDVKNAFLNGTLEEDIYMSQPPGYIMLEHPNWVRKLKKSLRGLKQAPRSWYYTLHKFLLGIGYSRLKSNSNICTRHTNSKLCVHYRSLRR